jgi:hypothetical protein
MMEHLYQRHKALESPVIRNGHAGFGGGLLEKAWEQDLAGSLSYCVNATLTTASTAVLRDPVTAGAGNELLIFYAYTSTNEAGGYALKFRAVVQQWTNENYVNSGELLPLIVGTILSQASLWRKVQRPSREGVESSDSKRVAPTEGRMIIWSGLAGNCKQPSWATLN